MDKMLRPFLFQKKKKGNLGIPNNYRYMTLTAIAAKV